MPTHARPIPRIVKPDFISRSPSRDTLGKTLETEYRIHHMLQLNTGIGSVEIICLILVLDRVSVLKQRILLFRKFVKMIRLH